MCRLSGCERRKEQTEQKRRAASFRLSHRLHVFVRRKHHRQWHRDSIRRRELHDQDAGVPYTGGAQRFLTNLAGTNEHPITLLGCAMTTKATITMNAN